MYTKDGYFKYYNGTITLFFLESEEDQFIAAFQTKSIKNICEAACLELDSDGLDPVCRWNHVRSEFDLIAQCTRMGFDDKYMAYSKLELTN